MSVHFLCVRKLCCGFLSGGADQSSATGQWCCHTTAGTGLLGWTSNSGACHSLVPQQLQVRWTHPREIRKWYPGVQFTFRCMCSVLLHPELCTRHRSIIPYVVLFSRGLYFAYFPYSWILHFEICSSWPLYRAYALMSKFSWTKLSQMVANPQKPQTLNPAKIKAHGKCLYSCMVLCIMLQAYTRW